jgi:hypothetical protein
VWLVRCQREIEDAFTIDGAIAWHNEAIEEVGRQVDWVRENEWSPRNKLQVVCQLMRLRLDLREAVANLRRIKPHDSALRWSPR